MLEQSYQIMPTKSGLRRLATALVIEGDYVGAALVSERLRGWSGGSVDEAISHVDQSGRRPGSNKLDRATLPLHDPSMLLKARMNTLTACIEMSDHAGFQYALWLCVSNTLHFCTAFSREMLIVWCVWVSVTI